MHADALQTLTSPPPAAEPMSSPLWQRQLGLLLESTGAVGGVGGKTGADALSHREHQVFWLLILGRSVSEIGAQLQLAPNSVSTYRARILEKLEPTTMSSWRSMQKGWEKADPCSASPTQARSPVGNLQKPNPNCAKWAQRLQCLCIFLSPRRTMSHVPDPYDADRRLLLRCACGREHAPMKHPLADLGADASSRSFMEASLVKALFPVDSVRRNFLRAVGANTARAAIASVLPVFALQAMVQEVRALEKKDLKLGFIAITCATPLIMAGHGDCAWVPARRHCRGRAQHAAQVARAGRAASPARVPRPAQPHCRFPRDPCLGRV